MDRLKVLIKKDLFNCTSQRILIIFLSFFLPASGHWLASFDYIQSIDRTNDERNLTKNIFPSEFIQFRCKSYYLNGQSRRVSRVWCGPADEQSDRSECIVLLSTVNFDVKRSHVCVCVCGNLTGSPHEEKKKGEKVCLEPRPLCLCYRYLWQLGHVRALNGPRHPYHWIGTP